MQNPQTHTFPETYSQNSPALHNQTQVIPPTPQQTEMTQFTLASPLPPPNTHTHTHKPHHSYHHQSRVRPFASGSAQPIVAWEQGSPAHQSFKAAPASSCFNPTPLCKVELYLPEVDIVEASTAVVPRHRAAAKCSCRSRIFFHHLSPLGRCHVGTSPHRMAGERAPWHLGKRGRRVRRLSWCP